MKSIKKLSGLLLAFWVASISLSVSAESVSGPYIAAGTGYNHLQTEKIPGIETGFGLQPGGNVKTDPGVLALASVGWGFSNGFRAELESGYRRNGLNRVTAGALQNAWADGDEIKSTIFLNALYDFEKTSFGVTPYVGLGVGHARIKWKNFISENETETVAHNSAVNQRVYQGIIGISFMENVIPNLSMTAEYRYMTTDGGRRHPGRVERSRFGAFPITTQLERTQDHALMIGVRYQFGGPKK